MENRIACPKYVFFDIENAENFLQDEGVYMTLFSHPSGTMLSKQRARVDAVQDRSFYFTVRNEEQVHGFGLIGNRNSSVLDDARVVIPMGSESDPLFRFFYTARIDDDDILVPVEMVKDYCHVDVEFTGYQTISRVGEGFPFNVVVTGNTCGIDAYTGFPLSGEFRYVPAEKEDGCFSFNLPRIADEELYLELYGKEGVFEDTGLVNTLDLWHVILGQTSITWVEKNLPDLRLVIDCQEMRINVYVFPWVESELDYEY